ncbi:MAG: hypothetical protein AAF717_21720 [Bacteroidota bacterium]
MFEDVKRKEVQKAVHDLIDEGKYDSTTYGLWWNGKSISPAGVISRVYENRKKPINRKTFTTDIAQKRLLELGFPIVDNSRQDGFFTEKELSSFSTIITQNTYDKNDEVDQNFGKFLNKVIWEKTKIWRDKLVEKGWKTDLAKKNWQRQSTGKGQRYSPYTWYRLFLPNQKSKLIFFTIGVGQNGDLEYKLDVKRNDEFFTTSKLAHFDSLRETSNSGYQYFSKASLKTSDWEKLIERTHAFISRHSKDLTKIASELFSEKRLMRLVWNTKDWHRPSGHKWNPKRQGNTDYAYHTQYGFGAEEWLFDPKFRYNGNQLGYVRGVFKMPRNESSIQELYLYSINPKSKRRVLIAKLKDVEIIWGENDAKKEELKLFKEYHDSMVEDLEIVQADSTPLRNDGFVPNIRFPWNEATVFSEPIPLDENLITSARFTALKIDELEENLLEEVVQKVVEQHLNFDEGNGTGSTSSHKRSNSRGYSDVNKSHAKITNDLHDYLKKASQFKGFKISTEKSRIGQKLIDSVAKSSDEHILFEVKTMGTMTQNIRQALGQAVEYSLMSDTFRADKIIIVGPAKPDKIEKAYLARIKKALKIPLKYWSYSFEEDELMKKFSKY